MKAIIKIMAVVIIVLISTNGIASAKTQVLQKYQNMVILKYTDDMTDKVHYFFDIYMQLDDERSPVYLSFCDGLPAVVAHKSMFNWDPPHTGIKFRVDKGVSYNGRLQFTNDNYSNGIVKLLPNDLAKLIAEMEKGKTLKIQVNMLYDNGRIVKFNLEGFKDMYTIYKQTLDYIKK